MEGIVGNKIMHDTIDLSDREALLRATLAASSQDQRTVDDQRRSTTPLLDGMSFHDSVRHDDDRGSVTEIFDPRWGWSDEPMVFSYVFTIRPGVVKGWGLHKLHEDRYFVLSGELELVLFDPRPESTTYGKICRVYLSGNRPRLVNVPKFVWHADRNIGNSDVAVVNFPTIQYDHSNPDKYRLPLNTHLIPYSFGSVTGW